MPDFGFYPCGVFCPGGVRQRNRRRTSVVGESRAAYFSGEWLSAFVVAGAAEPILSKRLQGRKANVVNVAASTAAGSGEFRAAGPPGESEPLRIMRHYATLAGPPTLSVVEGVAVRPCKRCPPRRSHREYRCVGRQPFGAHRVTAPPG